MEKRRKIGILKSEMVNVKISPSKVDYIEGGSIPPANGDYNGYF